MNFVLLQEHESKVIILKIIKNKLGNIFENDSNKLNVKDKTSESPLFECM
jgi:hypothetical protein